MADNDFGYTPWGKDWVRFAESLRLTRPDPKLPRARAMARDGKVQLTIDGRMVQAVIHHGTTVSTADIEVAPLSQPARVGISRLLCDARPVLTDELYREITDAGQPPAPTLVSVACSCGADTPRCIHLLAVYYEMARRIDDDPRVALGVQDFFRASPNTVWPDGVSPDGGEVPTAATPQRWIALNALDPADYFTAPS